MIVGGYSLHLYCKYEDCIENKIPVGMVGKPFTQRCAEFDGDTLKACKAQAEVKGWHFLKGDCICRLCYAKGRR